MNPSRLTSLSVHQAALPAGVLATPSTVRSPEVILLERHPTVPQLRRRGRRVLAPPNSQRVLGASGGHELASLAAAAYPSGGGGRLGRNDPRQSRP
jgi:hypothetical protein